MEHTSHFGKRLVTLMIGSNIRVLERLKAHEFNDIVWASDNLETVAHYYEGCAIQLKVLCDSSKEMEYIRSYEECPVALNDYTWGCAEMRCPAGAWWYSFSGEYLQDHLVDVEEIFPDLSKYMEEDA